MESITINTGNELDDDEGCVIVSYENEFNFAAKKDFIITAAIEFMTLSKGETKTPSSLTIVPIISQIHDAL